MSSLHAQKTLMHTEPMAITNADNVSILRFKQRACRRGLRGKMEVRRGFRVSFCDTIVAVLNENACYFTSIACDATHCHLSLRNTQTSVQRKVRLKA